MFLKGRDISRKLSAAEAQEVNQCYVEENLVSISTEHSLTNRTAVMFSRDFCTFKNKFNTSTLLPIDQVKATTKCSLTFDWCPQVWWKDKQHKHSSSIFTKNLWNITIGKLAKCCNNSSLLLPWRSTHKWRQLSKHSISSLPGYSLQQRMGCTNGMVIASTNILPICNINAPILIGRIIQTYFGG